MIAIITMIGLALAYPTTKEVKLQFNICFLCCLCRPCWPWWPCWVGRYSRKPSLTLLCFAYLVLLSHQPHQPFQPFQPQQRNRPILIRKARCLLRVGFLGLCLLFQFSICCCVTWLGYPC
jgi:hypothetical protein